MSEWIRRLAEKYSEVNEKKKLDPVGQADADIDNDGDVDKSDKYLHNRRKAIGKAMKNEEKDMSNMVCKECGDSFGKPQSESCEYDSEDEEGENWVAKESYKEDVDLEEATISAKMARRALASVKAQPKDKVSLKKAPWDKEDKKKVDEEEVIMNPKKEKDKKAEADTMANESFDLDEATGKEISSKMMKSKTMKAFASKVAKMPKVTRDDLEKMLPDYVSGADITKLFKESVLPPVYARIMEERAKHYKGATPPEGMMDNSKSSKGAMDMVNQPKEINNDDEKGHDDVSKAGRVGPSAKARPGDNMKGDKKVIPSATPMKGK